MKKFLMGSIVLTLFSITIIIFQWSCQKTAEAQTSTYILPPATKSTLGGVIIGAGLNVSNNGVLTLSDTTGKAKPINKLIYKKVAGTVTEIWVVNYDGSNNLKINITLPAGVVFSDDMQPVLSPDGLKIFFTAGTQYYGDIYSCSIDGSNLQKVVDKGGSNNLIILGGAY